MNAWARDGAGVWHLVAAERGRTVHAACGRSLTPIAYAHPRPLAVQVIRSGTRARNGLCGACARTVKR